MESLKAINRQDELPADSPPASASIDPVEHRNGVEEPQNDIEISRNGDSTKQQDPFVSALSESDPTTSNDTEKPTPKSPKFEDIEEDDDEDEDEDEDPPPKKQKQLSSLAQQQQEEEEEEQPAAIDDNTANNNNGNNVSNEIKTPVSTQATAKKKSKKKNNNNVWVTRSTRKGKKKTKPNPQNAPAEDKVLITPVPRFPDKNDDTPEMTICLSKVFKAEKVELSDDRMSAGSTKGYRMVRATRGVCEGAWYFEVKVASLGETGHTRLGWSMEKADLQAPVGYDCNSFGYRDIDGSKVHKALREKYGVEGYKEGDVIGFYINLPDGKLYNPKSPNMVWYKGQRYVCAPDSKEDPPKIVPGSEISFFKNGICQGTAFKDLYGGRYYPAASMYTLPNQPNCVVQFNFGPDFDFFPEDFGGRPIPKPMYEVPYHVFENRVENGQQSIECTAVSFPSRIWRVVSTLHTLVHVSGDHLLDIGGKKTPMTDRLIKRRVRHLAGDTVGIRLRRVCAMKHGACSNIMERRDHIVAELVKENGGYIRVHLFLSHDLSMFIRHSNSPMILRCNSAFSTSSPGSDRIIP